MNPSLRLFGKMAALGALALLVGCTVYETPPPRVIYASPPAVEPVPAPVVEYVRPPVGEEDAAEVEIRTEDDFYEPLRAYGRWEVVGSFGRCWIPGRVDHAWRPYCDGHWQRTDAGWFWASDEPWGWATYHYGRWDHSEQFGWYWVPQTQWAPAWVSWHQGGGYVGWAPLPPSSRFGNRGTIEVGVKIVAPQAYVFVQERQFLKPVHPTTVIVNNTTIINQTTNITNIKVVNQTVINEGPRPEIIQRATGQNVQVMPARAVRRQQEAKVVAPHVSSRGNAEQKNQPIHPVAEPRSPVTSTAGSAPKGTALPNEVHKPSAPPPVGHVKSEAIPAPAPARAKPAVTPATSRAPGAEKPKILTDKEKKRAKELADQAKRDAEKHAKEADPSGKQDRTDQPR